MKKYFALLFTLLIFIIPEVNAQDLDGWNINGQIQLRSELDGRDFSNNTHPLTFASLRTRLSVAKSLDEAVQFLIQFQDSRVFGEEPSTLSAIDNIDLHQGFVKLDKPFGWDFSVQAGRFEVKYGTERFFGAVGWHYVGRSFDGVRFTIDPDDFDLDLFALTLDESNNYIGNAVPSVYPYPQMPTPSESVYGFWKNTDITNESELDVFNWDGQ